MPRERTGGFPLEKAVLAAVCGNIDSDVARQVRKSLEENDDKSLLAIDIEPGNYETAISFSEDYLISSFLSKWKGLKTGINTREAAISSWLAGEQECRRTNKRLRRALQGTGKPHRLALDLIFEVQRQIERVVGPCPPDDIFARSRWSGGATFDSRRGAPFTDKMANSPSVTIAGKLAFQRLIQEDYHWQAALIGADGPCCLLSIPSTVVEGSRYLTVPKNAKTERSINAEPKGNAFMQQSIGQFIRLRLKRFGVDLDDQSVNQEYARNACLLDLATLDLRGASDSISIELIFALLPIEWALLLDSLRSKTTKRDGVWERLEKFSSMGNAFTFELESLIFWAILRAVLPKEDHHWIGVYGDDLIVPSTQVRKVRAALRFFGFSLNDQKSHWEGPFRESCGKHYFWSMDVTPTFQKEVVGEQLHEVIRLANRLVRWALRCGEGFYDGRIRKAWRIVFDFGRRLSYARNEPVPMIPLTSPDDDGFIVPLDWFNGKWDKHGTITCNVYVYVSRLKPLQEDFAYAYKLRVPQYSNAHPKGWAMYSAGGHWVFRKRKIPVEMHVG
jgi:hypothetical protein